MKRACQLCGSITDLRDSHLVPKFVFRWLLRTSATGYLRSTDRPNLRIKDGPKQKLFCQNCESLLSRYESYFASQIFRPHLEKPANAIPYVASLKFFSMSLAYRTALLFESKTDTEGHLNLRLAEAVEHWRLSLTGASLDDKYEHHVLPLDYIVSLGDGPPKHLNYYLMRAVHWDLLFGEDSLYIYTKIPGFAFITCIYPRRDKNFRGTKIFKSGSLKGRNKILEVPWGFLDYIKSKADTMTQIPTSEKQEEVTRSAYLTAKEADPERYYSSGTLKAMEFDLKLHKQQK